MNAKRHSRRIIAVILSMMLVIGCFVISAGSIASATDGPSEGNIEFIVHYTRADGDYSKSDVYVWAEGTDAAAQEVGFDSNGTARLEVPVATQYIGFIIRQVAGDWGTKDPDGDRKVDVRKFVGGTVEVSAVSGSAQDDFVTNTDNAVSGLKIIGANASDDLTKVTFDMVIPPSDDEIADIQENMTVNYTSNSMFAQGDGAAVAIESLDFDGNQGIVTLAQPLNKYSAFRLNYGFSSVMVKMPKSFYSEPEFEDQYTYEGDDLGVTYSKESSTFRVWSPVAVNMTLNLYGAGDPDSDNGAAAETFPMTQDVKGTWVVTLDGNLNGKYYTYTAEFEGGIVDADIVDPYARSLGVNGVRGMILDLDSTDPEGWDSDARQTYANKTDMVIYELSVRDFSSDPDSGIQNTGKYLAFTENGTKTSGGIATGIDHLKEMGITSVHLLPTYDFGWSEEISNEYNWGYDPVNYNAPEGSYSTDPYHGEVRVNEYKQMVKALHDAGIGVIMDAVYNHTFNTSFCYNRLVPGFYYRPDQNTSGCGNDVASERTMVRKFITDSVKYWVDEYHLDGVRFDLMGIIDVDTMNQIRADVDTIDSNVFLYGEGWDMGSKPTKTVAMANYHNAAQTPGIAYFSDTIRDGLRGNVFQETEPGYVGSGTRYAAVKDGVLYTSSWSPNPEQIINYDSCHDNHTIWDRLNNTNPSSIEGVQKKTDKRVIYTEEQRIAANKLSAAVVFTSQGVPFMMGGEEFLRTKGGHKDSVRAGDAVNMLDYSRIADYSDVNAYYQGLIAMRKAYPQFRMTSADAVKTNIEWLADPTKDAPQMGYRINSEDGDVLVYYNPSADWEVELPEGSWSVIANGEKAGTETLATVSGTVTVPSLTALVLAEAAKSADEGFKTFSAIGDLVGGWDVDVDLTPSSTANTYEATIKNVKAGDYEFKIRADHAWDTTWSVFDPAQNDGKGATSYPGGDNVKLSLPVDTDVKISFVTDGNLDNYDQWYIVVSYVGAEGENVVLNFGKTEAPVPEKSEPEKSDPEPVSKPVDDTSKPAEDTPKTEPQPTPGTDVPATGAESGMVWFVLLTLVAAAGVAVVVTKKSRTSK